MDLNLIKKLIKIVETSEIAEFEVEEGDLKVKISKNYSGSPVQTVFSNYTPPVQQAAPAAASHESSKPAAGDTEKKSNLHEVRSPIVGTFYRAPAPDADPYIQIGDSISQGSVLCIVEAMKLMNEIESDVSGKIIKILVENATPVEYNQPLFLVEKN